MAVLPADVPTQIVEGQFFFAAQGGGAQPTTPPATGYIRFTASVPQLRLRTPSSTLIPTVFDGVLVNGDLMDATNPSLKLRLPRTDTDQITPVGYTWEARFFLDLDPRDHQSRVDPYHFTVGSSKVNLPSVIPVEASPGVQIIQGPVGPPSTVPGPPGAGVPSGGSTGQLVRKTASGTEWVTPTKSVVGLGNVDNTSDANKPVSAAQKTALDAKISKGELVINVRDYGAKGDGITDDTAAVQAAVDAGSHIYFPAGNYYLKGVVIVHSAMEIFGDPGAVIVKGSGHTSAVVFFAPGRQTTGYGAIRDVYIHDLDFRGNLATNHACCVLNANRLSGLKIERIRVFEAVINGHVFDLQGCENVLIQNSEFYGARTSAERAYTEVIQIDCSTVGGMSVPDDVAQSTNENWDGTPTRDVVVRNNKFGPSIVNGVKYGSACPIGSHSSPVNTMYTNIQFIDNEVVDVQANTVNWPGLIHFISVEDLTVRGNNIRCTEPTFQNAFVRIFRATSPASEAHNTVIEDNVVVGLRLQGTHLTWLYGADGARARNVSIRRNKFIDCQVGVSTGYLIQATWLENPEISDNYANTGPAGFIYNSGSISPRIERNKSNGGAWFALNMDNNYSPVIRHNEFLNLESRVQINNCTDITVDNNIVSTNMNDKAIRIIGTPMTTPTFVRVTNNTAISTRTSEVNNAGIEVVPAYSQGMVSGNISRNYVGTHNSSMASTLTAINNIKV